MIHMDSQEIKKWVYFFLGILVAIVIANALSTIVTAYAGITGMTSLIVNFILYAAFFFAILYAIEKITGIEFFGFDRM